MRSLLLLSAFLLCAFLLVATLSSTTTDTYGPTTGGYHPICNLSDPEVQEMARFAVAENNKQTNGVLELIRVVSGDQQVVEGMNYRLIFEASSVGGVSAKYEAVVFDQLWTKTRRLISFHKVNYHRSCDFYK